MLLTIGFEGFASPVEGTFDLASKFAQIVVSVIFSRFEKNVVYRLRLGVNATAVVFAQGIVKFAQKTFAVVAIFEIRIIESENWREVSDTSRQFFVII